VVLVAPESAIGGPLALVRCGDRIRLDVRARALDMLVPEEELARRRAAWTPAARDDERGYRALYWERVLQANEGCDLAFVRGRSSIVTETVTYL
jgi:dihydroxy-acid dehydratase